MSDAKDMPLHGRTTSPGRGIHYTLWTIQALLALLFLFAGVIKLIGPAQANAQKMNVSIHFFQFIGVVETLGGLGMVLPGLLRTATGLTPLAAAGLVIIMIGAVVISLQSGPPVTAILPLVTGLLAAFVAYGRWKMAPL
jgi:hypothetical protein